MGSTLVPSWAASLEDVEAADHIGGTAAAVVGFGLNLFVPLVIGALLAHRARRISRAAAEARRLEAGAHTPPGEATEVICGVVEAGDEPAMRVSIRQLGSERQYKGGWTTTWNETAREIDVRPFVLLTASGERVRCEPDERTRLVDDLDRVERTSLHERTRRAELTTGERAIVRGRIRTALGAGPGSAYRDGARELVMKPAFKGMEISTKGLAAPLEEGAALRWKWAKIIFIAVALAQLPVIRWHASVWQGEVEPATVVDASSRLVKTKNSFRTVHTVVLTPARGGNSVDEEVDSADASRLPRGTIAPIRVSSLSTILGARPSDRAWFFLVGWLGVSAVLGMAAVAIRTARPWYERKELVDSIPGRLSSE